MTKPPLEILLVEGNPGDARLVAQVLRTAGRPCRVQVVADGAQALQRLHQTTPPPNLILLDLNLSTQNGCQVLAEIKSHDQLKRIPVVIVSESACEADILQAYQLQANCYVTKPQTSEALVEVLHGVKEFWLSTVSLPEH